MGKTEKPGLDRFVIYGELCHAVMIGATAARIIYIFILADEIVIPDKGPGCPDMSSSRRWVLPLVGGLTNEVGG